MSAFCPASASGRQDSPGHLTNCHRRATGNHQCPAQPDLRCPTASLHELSTHPRPSDPMTASPQDVFLAFSNNRFCGAKRNPERRLSWPCSSLGTGDPTQGLQLRCCNRTSHGFPCPCSSWYPELDAIARGLDAIYEHENGLVFLSNTAACTRAWKTSLQKHLFPFSEVGFLSHSRPPTHPSLFTFKLAFHLNQPGINRIYRDRPARGAIPPGMDILAPGSELL